MNLFLRSAVASAIVCAASASVAQNANLNKPYLGIEYASAKFKEDSSLTQRLISGVGGTANSSQDTNVTASRIFGGLAITENLGAELGYVMSSSANGRFSGVSSTAVAYAGTSNIKATGLDYSALIRPSKSTGFNGLFLRLGGHSLELKNDVTVTSGSVSLGSTSTINGSGTLIGIGYDGSITNQLDYRVSYTSYSKVAGNSAYDFSSINLGLAYKF